MNYIFSLFFIQVLKIAAVFCIKLKHCNGVSPLVDGYSNILGTKSLRRRKHHHWLYKVCCFPSVLDPSMVAVRSAGLFRARPCHLLGEFIKDCSDGLLFLKALLFFSALLQRQCHESGLLPPSGQMVTLMTASVTRKSYFALNQAEIHFFQVDTVSPSLALLEPLCCWLCKAWQWLLPHSWFSTKSCQSG